MRISARTSEPEVEQLLTSPPRSATPPSCKSLTGDVPGLLPEWTVGDGGPRALLAALAGALDLRRHRAGAARA